MATHASAEKRDKQNKKRNARNKQARSTLRSAVKEVGTAISKKDSAVLQTSLKTATSLLAKAANKKLVHKKTAARKISRLTKKANASKK